MPSSMPVKSRKPSENRKIRKPIMEKKRRERINSCIARLGEFVKEQRSTEKNGSKSNKMEKADILELAVKYIERQKENKHLENSTNKKYITGFSNCMELVKTLVSVAAPEVTNRVMHQLEKHKNTLKEQISPKISSFEDNSEEVCTDLRLSPVTRENGKLMAYMFEGSPHQLFSSGTPSRASIEGHSEHPSTSHGSPQSPGYSSAIKSYTPPPSPELDHRKLEMDRRELMWRPWC